MLRRLVRNDGPRSAGRQILTLLSAIGFCLVAGRAAGQDGVNDPAYFANLKKQAAELQKQADELNAKIAAAAKPHLDAQAAAMGGQEQARKKSGASLSEINAKLGARAGQTPTGNSKTDPRIEPGMKMTVMVKRNSAMYKGTLVGVKDGNLLLQTIHEEGARPSEIALKDIAAFQIDAGIFAYNTKTSQIVPAVTCYSYNAATKSFDRMDSCPNTYLAEKATVSGATKSTPAFFSAGVNGTWGLGLPVPFDNSQKTIPAAAFQKIVTSEGVYRYDTATKSFTYKSHEQFAKEAQDQKDAAGKKYYQDQWDRDKQSYQLETNRIQAMQPNWGWPWTGGSPPWYAQSQPPTTPQQ